MLVFIALCGIYICWMGVDYSAKNSRPHSMDTHTSDQCSGTVVSNTIRHYPKRMKYGRGSCICSPVHKFVIVSMQRSGSGWFETLLNSHPNISSHGEVFSVKSRRKNFSAILSTLDTIYNLDWISSAAKNGCTRAVGFKWMLNQAEALAAYQPLIDTDFLPAHLQRVQDITNDAIRFFNNTRHTIIYYEDLVKDNKILEVVLTFLDVPQIKLGSQHVKIHTKPLREQIKNWEEVSSTLEGTKFEDLLKDNDYL